MAVAVATVISFSTATDAQAGTGQIRAAGTAEVVADSYVVALKDTVAMDKVSAKAGELSARFGGRTGHIFHTAVRGFEVSMSERDAKRLAADPSVAYVQQNGIYHVADTQSPTPSWGLDRIDQRNLPLNNAYTFPTAAIGVKAYVIDTGIRLTHTDFGGRAVSGVDEIDGGAADDAHGHGTHVAATLGGSRFGVAKGVTLVAVRVLDTSGNGTSADVIAGVDWVTADHQPGELAVANMSLGGGPDDLLDKAVTRSIDDGVVYGVAAGNENRNACFGSPARVETAITVGATTISDARWSLSNVGPCLDIFAPGAGITSAWNGSDTDVRTANGTSMATPHVVGAAAIVLAQNPTLQPFHVRELLVELATTGVVTNPGPGSPNRLLFCCPVSVTSTTVTPNADGRLTMFAADSVHSVWTRTQLAPGSDTWSSWSRFATELSTIVAKTNGNGLIEVFGADETGKVWHRWQSAPNSTSWSTWEVFAPVYRGERLVCVIEHDEILGQQPAVARAAAAAAGLAIERSELYERLHQQMRQLNDSRRRLADAALEERRRIQRDLHDRAQQQLYGVLGQLGIARLQMVAVVTPEATSPTAMVEQAHANLRRAIEELGLLIQAIYPAVLTEHGLAAAVEELADQAPVPVTVRIPARRWPEPLVRTAYFIISEALGNVYKHAHATHVTVDVTDGPDRLLIEVSDDGVGLPTTPHPPRLRSLVDRADAVGGSLHTEPATPCGTRVVAQLPKERHQ